MGWGELERWEGVNMNWDVKTINKKKKKNNENLK